jgi:hypothetical protein
MVMASLLRDPGTYNFDIIAIQEPWKNPYTATTHHPAKDRSHLCYPTGDTEGSARVCFHYGTKSGKKTQDECGVFITEESVPETLRRRSELTPRCTFL